MTTSSSHFVDYALAADGSVRHWLTCGPLAAPIEHLERFVSPTDDPFNTGGRWVLNYWAYHPQSIALKKQLYDDLPALDWRPASAPVFNQPAPGGQTWRFAMLEDDTMADFSRFSFTPSFLQAWSVAYLHTERAQTVQAEVLTIGPFHLGLNDAESHYDATFSYVAPLRVPVTLDLQPGDNALTLHGVLFGWRESRFALGLRLLDDVKGGVRVRLPIGDIEPSAWREAEAVLQGVQIRQFAFPSLSGEVALDHRAQAPLEAEIEIRTPPLNSPWALVDGVESASQRDVLTLEPGQTRPLAIQPPIVEALMHLPGENTLHLSVRPTNGVPIECAYHIWAGTNTFSLEPYGTYESRLQEAREHLAGIQYDLMASLAAVEIGRAERIDSRAVALALHFLTHRYDCADFYSISLLAVLYRCADSPQLSPGDQNAIEAAFRAFKFWIDEPGLDGMCYFTENHQILFHVVEYLAGQRWPEWTFTNSGLTGEQHREKARPVIESWILRRLRGGYSEWDSNAYMALDVYAMLALVEFSEEPHLQAMATTLVHKTLFMLAMQSFRGVHGASHGRCYVEGLKSARVENTSGLQRIAWGMGIFNGETRATGLLALARRYRVPDIIQRIGADMGPMTIQARSRESFQLHYDMRDDEWDVSTHTVKTPQYMLAAAVDHRPGEMGVQEHLWQATLGPEAMVFSSYPGNNQEHGHARPNFWAGSVVLPRVALVDHAVICLYPLREDVGLGYTHAYFPVAMFDEVRLSGSWAFARKGDGYLALWSEGTMALTERGRHAYQELRSVNGGRVWLCQMGRRADDGDFSAFCQRLIEHPPTYAEHLQWTRPDGQQIAFGWEGPLKVNGEAVPLGDYPLYRSPHTDTPLNAEQMVIAHQGESLTLDLKQGQRAR